MGFGSLGFELPEEWLLEPEVERRSTLQRSGLTVVRVPDA